MQQKPIEIMELIEFDFRKGTFETIPIADALPDYAQRSIMELERNMGIKLLLQGIDNSEHFIRTLYEKKGYKINHLPFVSLYSNETTIENRMILAYCEANFQLNPKGYCRSWHELLNKAGVPDFVAYKVENDKIKELVFIEVKSNRDSVRFEQIFWVYSSNVPSKIVYCKEDKKY